MKKKSKCWPFRAHILMEKAVKGTNTKNEI